MVPIHLLLKHVTELIFWYQFYYSIDCHVLHTDVHHVLTDNSVIKQFLVILSFAMQVVPTKHHQGGLGSTQVKNCDYSLSCLVTFLE